MYPSIRSDAVAELAAIGGIGRFGELALVDGDAACQRSMVAVDTVVGYLQVMAPAVHEDATAALRTVGDGDAVNARRVAQEVAGEIVAVRCAIGQHGGAIREGSFRPLSPDIDAGSGWIAHALGKDGDARAF